MIGTATGPQPHASHWRQQNQADSADEIGFSSSPGVSRVQSHTARVPRVQPLLPNMAARDWSRGRSNYATATKVKFINRCRPETRRRERVG